MKNDYEYMKQVQYLDSFSVEDIGNCCIQAFTDEGDQYVLLIRTVLGVSRILQVGPIQDGFKTFCTCTFTQMDYADKKLDSTIYKFVNGKTDFTQVQVIDIKTKKDMEDIIDTLPVVKELMLE